MGFSLKLNSSNDTQDFLWKQKQKQERKKQAK